MSKFNRPTLNIISILCFLATLLMSCWFSGAVALPIHVAQAETSNFPRNFFSYLDDKYTLYLGDNRGACAYSIDPTEVYEQGNNRFVTARVRQGAGTACRDAIDFSVLQADCQANKFYKIEREEVSQAPGSGGPTRYRWRQFEMSLSDWTGGGGFSSARHYTSEDLASKVCALPVRSTTTRS